MSFFSGAKILAKVVTNCVATSTRGLARIPHWEYHIRFDPHVGRKVPNKDVLDRCKRLNNGMWVKTVSGRKKSRYLRKEPWLTQSNYLVTCTQEECEMLDKLMTPFWLRKKHYIEDPYEAYHSRNGLKTPRLGKNRKIARERQKILLEDSVADQYFADR